MSRTFREMVAELGMLVAALGLVGALALAVFGAVLVDYGPESPDCPEAGTASWQWAPPGLRCTSTGADGEPVTSYVANGIPLALAGAGGALVLLLVARHLSLRLQEPHIRTRDPVYAEDLAAQLDRRTRAA